MNIEVLQNIYINSVRRIFNPDSFKIIADHHNNTYCDSFTNRALTFIQNRFATDVRSIDAWEIAGRTVSDKAIPIGIVKSIMESQYIDNQSNKAVNIKELTPEEFRNAIRIGLISKQQSIKDIECASVYDIRDTTVVVDNTDDNKKNLKLSSLYNVLNDIGISVVKEGRDDTTFDNKSMTVIIGMDSVENKLRTCLKALAIGAMSICDVDIESSYVVESVSVLYTVYSVLTYYDMDTSNIQFGCLNDLDEEDIDAVTEILDTIEALIRTNIFEPSSKSIYGIRPDKLARASLLLSILESNYEAHQLKGD